MELAVISNVKIFLKKTRNNNYKTLQICEFLTLCILNFFNLNNEIESQTIPCRQQTCLKNCFVAFIGVPGLKSLNGKRRASD